jgi:hypothetical protein
MDPETLVSRWIAVWPAGDRAAAEAMVASDFNFTSPLDNRLDRAMFFKRCWPNSARMARMDIIRMATTGQTVLVPTS